MAADAVKERNMPTISANIYCGLQKWVNRASITLRGRPRTRSRLNSDVSNMTMYTRKALENMAKQPETQERIVPVHGRSRSNPVSMSESSLHLKGEYLKIAKVPTSRQASNASLRRKKSSELSDDSSSQGSYRERNMSVLNQRLSQNLSKSESCLVNGGNDRSSRSKSQTAPNSVRRRKSSDTDGSLDSNSSEIDINDNRKPRTSRSLSKTNKPDRSHSVEPKIDFMGANSNELSPRNLEVKSQEIHTRLDRWIEKSAVFQDSRQSSLESTSSSDDIFYRDQSARLNETQHFRDLQTAIHELVSSCGRNTTNATNGETVETTTERKISLKNAGPLFNKTVSDIDSNNLDEQQNGHSDENNSSKSINLSEIKEEHCQHKKTNGIINSCDDTDGCVDVRDEIRVGELSKVDDNHDSVHDIGPDSDSTRAMNVLHNHALHDAQIRNSTTTHDDTNSLALKTSDDQELRNTDSQFKPGHGASSSNEHKRTSPIPVDGKNISFEDNMLNITTKSPKDFRAPSPPRKLSGKKTSQTKTKTPVFDDKDLTAFALECVQHARKKKPSLEKNERYSKSDSDEEQKLLDHDFVYLPRNRQAIKASTHPKTTFHEQALSRGALSDDDSFMCVPSRLREKAGSADSLDGFVLFDEQIKDIDFEENKSNSSNENENTKGQEKTDYTRRGGLKKFPSMPLFYVPKEFDGSSETKSKSLGKSLWKRIKSIPRTTENHRTSQSTSQKTKQPQSDELADPFYHGEKDEDQVGPRMRPKSNSVGSRKASDRRRRRMSLDSENVSKPSINVTQPSEDHTQDDQTIIKTRPSPDESQC